MSDLKKKQKIENRGERRGYFLFLSSVTKLNEGLRHARVWSRQREKPGPSPQDRIKLGRRNNREADVTGESEQGLGG